ncbi:unnamed protein product [Schistosoma haematobium]|nr:unnamed protein product [Schistosoma haematobium]
MINCLIVNLNIPKFFDSVPFILFLSFWEESIFALLLFSIQITFIAENDISIVFNNLCEFHYIESNVTIRLPSTRRS